MTEHNEEPMDPLEAEERDDAVIGVVFKRSLIVFAVIACLAIAGLWFAREKESEPEVFERDPIQAPATLGETQGDVPSLSFTDVTRQAGLNFQHESGATGEKLLPETMGSGAAFLDFDDDGDQDIFLVNATHWPWSDAETLPTSALFVNQGDGSFIDGTAKAGLGVTAYGTGVACGDIDNDGDTDLFLAALGENKMLRNDDGRFVDITATAGVAGDAAAWSTSAGFADFDNDGDLDLFVCNYVQWSKEIDLELNFSINGRDRAYGPPTNYRGSFSSLYINDGTGVFEDRSAASGIEVTNPATQQPLGKALALTFADADGDGLIDIFVANDTVQNFVFHNQGDGEFKEYGSSSGVAFDQMGSATGAMGMDAGDYANRGDLAIGIGNFSNEASSLYVQQSGKAWQFVDMSNTEGIGSPSRLKLSFGLFFFDCDLDGRLDMLQANGHLEDEINEIQPSQHYRQPTQLFWNRGSGQHSTFVAVPESETGDLATPIIGRGASFADIDADGDLDVLLTQTGDAPKLLRNDLALDHHWLRVKLVGTRSNRDAIGAWVKLQSGELVQKRQVMPTRSYLSQVELPLTFGLGNLERVDRLEITWPNGDSQVIESPAIDQSLTIVEE